MKHFWIHHQFNEMAFLKYVVVFFIGALVICDAKPKEKSQKEVVLLKDYVLVPTEYANDMLKDHLDDVQTTRENSLAALADLINNRTEYTTDQGAQVLVNVIRQAVDVLYPTYQDIRALVFPSTTLNETITIK